MARVKPKRHGVVTDMTAMCDVAFLLLTFFILTTQFRKPDVETIKPPTSISEKLLEDGSVMTVNVTQDGRFYFNSVENNSERMTLLENMGKKYGMTFSDAEKTAFVKTPSFGIPMSQMRSFLALPEEQRKAYKGAGIPLTKEDKQVIEWIKTSLDINQEYKLAIKGDEVTKYPQVKALFEGLRDIKFYKFWLITNQEGK